MLPWKGSPPRAPTTKPDAIPKAGGDPLRRTQGLEPEPQRAQPDLAHLRTIKARKDRCMEAPNAPHPF
jgi:hypothetical protein